MGRLLARKVDSFSWSEVGDRGQGEIRPETTSCNLPGQGQRENDA